MTGSGLVVDGILTSFLSDLESKVEKSQRYHSPDFKVYLATFFYLRVHESSLRRERGEKGWGQTWRGTNG